MVARNLKKKKSTSGPIHRSAPFFVPRNIGPEIVQSLGAGDYVTLLGGRQSGKTTTVQFVLAELDLASVPNIFVDLQGYSQIENEQEWSANLSSVIATTVNESKLFSDDSQLKPCEALVDLPSFLEDAASNSAQSRPTVIAFDEITAIPQKIQTAFFSGLRSLHARTMEKRLGGGDKCPIFLFSGTFDPEALITGENSPFNVSKEYNTNEFDFSREQVEQVAHYFECIESTDNILSVTGGHPSLTVRLAELVGQDGMNVDEGRVRMLADDTHIRHMARIMSLQDEPVVDLLNSIIAGDLIPFRRGVSPSLDYLASQGIAKSNLEGNVTLRSPMYRTLGELGDDPENEGDLEFDLGKYAARLMEIAPTLQKEDPGLAIAAAGIAFESKLLETLETNGAGKTECDRLNEDIDKGLVRGIKKIQKINNPGRWELSQMIEIARYAKIFSPSETSLAHILRDWRNFVHPAKIRRVTKSHQQFDLAAQAQAAIANSEHLIRNCLT